MKDFFKTLLAVVLGTGLVLGIGLLFVLGLLSSLGSLLGGPDPASSSAPASVLVLDFPRVLGEQDTDNPLDGILPAMADQNSTQGFLSYIQALELAAADPRITMVYLKPQYLQAELSPLEELREALLRFRQSGKAVISYADTYSQAAYYLASVADKVYLNPLGTVELKGMALHARYYKELFDKVGVEVQVVKHGIYKGAGEEYTLRRMSAEQAADQQQYVDEVWDHWTAEIARARGLEQAAVGQAAARLSLATAQDVLAAGLVDGLYYAQAMREHLASLQGVSDPDQLQAQRIEDYHATQYKPSYKIRDQVAVLYATGEVMLGSGDGMVGTEDYLRHIRRLEADSTTKAVVLRVNSPGGDPIAADNLTYALESLARTKPLVVSMGDYAASGGYWFSLPAHYIMASPLTLTGSIGVYSLSFNAERALKETLGVWPAFVTSSPHAAIHHWERSLDAEELGYLQRTVDSVYQRFTNLVCQYRPIAADTLDRVAQGRIVSGMRAKDLGLVDALGGLVPAIEEAARRAGLENYRVVEFPRPQSFMDRVMERISGATSLIPASGDLSASALWALWESRLARLHARPRAALQGDWTLTY